MSFVVIACGGRTYTDVTMVKAVFDSIHAVTPITLMVEGGQTGADRLAEMWAINNGVRFKRERADWKRHGNKYAGPIRNKKMLDDYDPDLVVCFPGGNGTRNMRMQALAASETARGLGLKSVKLIVVGAEWKSERVKHGEAVEA
jgi:hypothetical protein